MDQCAATTSNHQPQQHHEHRGILSLLSARSLVGSSSSSNNRWVRRGSLRNGSSAVSCATVHSTIVTNANLAKGGAWNVRRLQNMILIVGPGTPAWNVDVADKRMNNGRESPSSSSLYSFSGEEEEENEDDGRFVHHSDGDDNASLQMDSSYCDAEIDDDDDNTITSTNNNRHRSNWELSRTHTIALPTSITQSPTAVEGCEHQQSSDSFHGDDNDCNDHSYQHDNTSIHSSSRDSGSSSDNDDDSDDYDEFRTQARRWQRQQHDRSRASGRQQQQPQQQSNDEMNDKVKVTSSMKHGGCINTASWLDCGWRISTASSHSSINNNDTVMPVSSTEYPTQLLTSGDDTLVKFWDVSQSMGSTSPLPGGSATYTPFSSPKMPMYADDELVDTWRGVRRVKCELSSSTINNRRYCLPGTVQPLLTLNTGHLANIFHATPVPNSPGKIVSCGADGFLRLHDVVVQGMSPTTTHVTSNMGIESSSIIVSPQDDDESRLFYRGRSSSMCFSHHFLSSYVGLVCSKRGLLHFDIRLPPRSQNMHSIIPELSKTCKACYPWRIGWSMLDDDNNRVGNVVELESAYVFAGGTKDCTVGLYDLRMTGSDSSSTARIVQIYQPRALANKSVSKEVSVSGIDVSKNKRELLVSYESDHIYTFPIFGCNDDPTNLDFDKLTASTATDTNKVVSELATYGVHLNRLTFLKAAKYAGPNDEYICTGSDSGHAYIYHKQSGSVASLIKADTSTCNGIVPHPTLPVFITYGIDSTAKLWRAITPVDTNVDDSDLGRFQYNSNEVRYQKSIVVDQWERIKEGRGEDFLKDEDLCFFPDEMSDDKDDEDHFLSMFVGSQRMMSHDSSFIGNDMINLCQVVSKCYYTCVKSISGSNEPVKSGIAAMKTRVNLIKLRHQADRLGLSYNIHTPWVFKHKEHLLKSCISKKDEGICFVKDTAVSYGCLADLIPDNPSDWLPFDKHMANRPYTGGMQVNLKHKHYHLKSSADYSVPPISRQVSGSGLLDDENDNESAIDEVDGDENDPVTKRSDYDPNEARNILLQTITLLKEAGNQALKASLPFLAARRYDKAINYCSVAYIKFPFGNVNFLHDYQTCECKWDEILKLLIAVRLNLALVCLSNEINDAKCAAVQASLSLKELKAFATQMGTVLTGEKLESIRSDEPHNTFYEAKALQAKAYFRLGSALLARCDYGDAVKTFQKCVASTKDANLTVDAGIVRKMNEAMRCHKHKKERQRKKYKAMFFANEDIIDGK